MDKFVPTGTLAKNADTTKRTLFYYDKLGLLSPKLINSKGDRFYSNEQIRELKLIKLANLSGISLIQLKDDLKAAGYSFKRLFSKHRKQISAKIKVLNEDLAELTGAYNTNKTLFSNFIKNPFKIQSGYSIKIEGEVEDAFYMLNDLSNYFTNFNAEKHTPFIAFDIQNLATTTFEIGVLNINKIRPNTNATLEMKKHASQKGIGYKKITAIKKNEEPQYFKDLLDQVCLKYESAKSLICLIHNRRATNKTYLAELVVTL